MLVKISDHLCLPLKNLNQPVWFYASNHFTYDSKITWFVEGFVYQVKLRIEVYINLIMLPFVLFNMMELDRSSLMTSGGSCFLWNSDKIMR